MRFVWSDTVAEAASEILADHAERIRARLPDAEVRHTGGSSVPGVLTTGDVDLQVRVAGRAFTEAREVLCHLYEPLHPDAWHETSAYFRAAESDPPVEVALTVMGTLDDLHHGDAWARIGADAALRDKYNALKRAHEGGPDSAYERAKRAFFRENFRM